MYPTEVDLYTDGCSKGNPGEAGAGILVTEVNNKKRIFIKKSIYLGDNITNNMAEYEALIHGLKICLRVGVTKINIYMDSELVVNQVTGNFQVRNRNIGKLYTRTILLLKNFKSYKIIHITRDKNSEADYLANQALLKKEEFEDETA